MEPWDFQEKQMQIHTGKDRVMELWEERTSEERLQRSKEIKRWTRGEKSGGKCKRSCVTI